MLTKVSGLGTVGRDFQSIHSFGQVFALAPGDLVTPATVNSKVSVYQNQSTQTVNTTQDSTTTQIGGGSGLTSPGNASNINGILVVGTPKPTYILQFDGTNLVWVIPPTGSGGSLDGGTFLNPL